MARRIYSDEDRAAGLAALDANEGRLSQTAREIGVPRSTLRQWIKSAEHRDRAAPAKVRQEKKEDLADIFERIARKATGIVELTLSDFEGVTIPVPLAVRLMTAAGIAVDKAQLLRGGATARLEVADLRARLESEGVTDADVMAEVERILADS